jgi:hypothetical protein
MPRGTTIEMLRRGTHGTHWATHPHRARGNLVTAGPGGTPAKPTWAAQPSPALGGPGRLQTVVGCVWEPGSALLDPYSRNFFFSPSPFCLALLSRGSPRNAFMQRHGNDHLVVDPLALSDRVDLGLSVLFHILGFCGHIIPATAGSRHLFANDLSSWSYGRLERHGRQIALPYFEDLWHDICEMSVT